MSRSVLNTASRLVLAGVWALTGYALFGPHPVPPRIPTHFDWAGHANGWGEKWMLCLAPGIATAIYLLMSVVACFPQSFNYPVRVTPSTRPRMEGISLDMIAWIKAEFAGLFFYVQYATIRSAREGANGLSPWFVPCILVVVFGTIALHFAALVKASRADTWTDPQN